MRWKTIESAAAGRPVGAPGFAGGTLFFEDAGYGFGAGSFGWDPWALGFTLISPNTRFPKYWQNKTGKAIYFTSGGISKVALNGQVMRQSDGSEVARLATSAELATLSSSGTVATPPATGGMSDAELNERVGISPVATNPTAPVANTQAGIGKYGISFIAANSEPSTAITVLRQRLVYLQVATAAALPAVNYYGPDLAAAIARWEAQWTPSSQNGIINAAKWDMINAQYLGGKKMDLPSGGPGSVGTAGAGQGMIPDASAGQATAPGATVTAPPPPGIGPAPEPEWISGVSNAAVGGAALLVVLGLAYSYSKPAPAGQAY